MTPAAVLPALSSPRLFIGRQPVVDAQRRICGDLLWMAANSAGDDNPGPSRDPSEEQAAREMLNHWLLLIPEPTARVAFLPCTRTLLLQEFVRLLPPANTVLTLPPGLLPDPELLACCDTLRRQGYRFALDGFRPGGPRLPFLDLASFLHFDFSHTYAGLRREIYAAAPGQAQLLAGQLENELQMRTAIDEGCTLFHGAFIAQPAPLPSASVPRNYLVYLRLLAALDREPADLRAVESLISGDPTLCYRILRLANSALMAHAGEISTVREALLMVGDDAVRRMATLAVAGALAGRLSPAVLEMALARARFCELLAPSIGQDPAQLYLLGMVSALDSLLEAPLHRILQSLPLRPEMKSALAGDSSPAGRALELVHALEACDWPRCQSLQYRLDLEENVIAAASVAALRWASESVAGLSAPDGSERPI